MMRSSLLIRRLATSPLLQRAAPASSTLLPTTHNSNATLHNSTAKVTITPPMIPTNIKTRPFSSSAGRKLGSILQREINEETDAGSGSDTLPPELAQLHSEISQNWTILEGLTGIGSDELGGGATVRMFKKSPGSNGAKIGIVFHCQDTEEDKPFDEEEMYEDQEQEAEDEESGTAVRFAVTVSKGGKTVVMQCRSAEGEISVETVAVRDGDAESTVVALAGGEGLHAALYQGPDFHELAEDLQIAFNNYVEKECGVDGDVTAFITMYADYREQEEYVDWMKTAIGVLA